MIRRFPVMLEDYVVYTGVTLVGDTDKGQARIWGGGRGPGPSPSPVFLLVISRGAPSPFGNHLSACPPPQDDSHPG